MALRSPSRKKPRPPEEGAPSGQPNSLGLSQQLAQVRELAQELSLRQQELLRKIHDLVASVHRPPDSAGA